jgi:hypothetical protein
LRHTSQGQRPVSSIYHFSLNVFEEKGYCDHYANLTAMMLGLSELIYNWEYPEDLWLAARWRRVYLASKAKTTIF